MTIDRDLPRKFFEMLLESQYWSPAELRAYQRGELSQLLRHARATVPFYEKRLDVLFRGDGDIDWDRWTEVPIITRQDIVTQGPQMLARELAGGHGGRTISTTSGTSGPPITLTSTRLALAALNGNRFRAYRWHGIDCARDCCAVSGDDPDVDAWPDGKVLGPWGPEWDVDALDGTLIRINRLTSNEQILEFLERRRPAYLTTGPNTALALALSARHMGADIRLEAFLPHGAAMTDRSRATIGEVFGARSVDLYSSKEAGHIAHACPEGDGLHVNAESLLVEIVGEDGRPVAAGVEGRVVITPFFNAAQPLIRYEQGDLASWGRPCSCGRHLPTLAAVVGRRSTALFYHPDGRVRHGNRRQRGRFCGAHARSPVRRRRRDLPPDGQPSGRSRRQTA